MVCKVGASDQQQHPLSSDKEIQVPGPGPRPTELETLGVECSNLDFNHHPDDSAPC